MPVQPTGTVTFLFTDIEGSTQLWEESPQQMSASLARHDELLRQAIEGAGGYVFKTVGDAFCAAFASPGDALNAAVAAQQALANEEWTGAPIRTRMAFHTGAAEERAGDYFGPPVNKVARLMSAGHGGQILLSQASRDLVTDHLPAGTELDDLGEHRLKDLSQPVHIFQLTVAELPSEFPPLKTLSATVSNIPVQATPFVGRQEEVASILNLLVEKNRRLVTLVGPGGMGKTRLAIEVAGRLVDSYRDGAFFVALTPLNTTGEIVQAIIEAMGISFSGGGDLKELLLRYLRRRHSLLLLDSYDHLLSEAPLLAEVLQATPGVTLLTTSRQKLNLSGETVFNLSGLGVADWRTPEDLLAHSAGELFVRSAQRVMPGFEVGAEDVPNVAQICRMVGGMPLGILLAAAWVDQLTPQEIAGEISRSLDFLETEMRDVPDRQRSIRAVFETSWERLSAAERELFKKLSVFPGGFTREAAGQVAGASMRELAGLANKSFLRRNPDTGRYEVHELLRQYAAELMAVEPETSAAVRNAHAAYFTDFLAGKRDGLRSARQGQTLDEIERDIENVRAAWRYLSEQGQAAAMGKIIEPLWYFHEIRGWYHAGLELFGHAETALRAAGGEEAHEVVAAQIQGVRGFYTSLLGAPQQGREMIEEALATLDKLERRREKLVPLLGLAVSNIFLGQGEAGIKAARAFRDIGREMEHAWWETIGTTLLGSSSMTAQAFADGRRYAEEAASRWTQIGDPWGSIWPGLVLARLAEEDYAEAKRRYLFVLAQAESVNFRRGLQYTYSYLGNISLRAQEYLEAEEYYLQSLAISDEIDQTREVVATLLDVAHVRAATERVGEAVELLATVLHHPASVQFRLLRQSTIAEAAEELRAELEAQLPADAYAAAWESGKRQELEDVVAGVLAAGVPSQG